MPGGQLAARLEALQLLPVGVFRGQGREDDIKELRVSRIRFGI